MKPIINLDALVPQLISERVPNPPEKYRGAAVAPISPLIGGQKLGYNLTIVPPGKAAYPFHNHHGNEELFFILEGSGLLRYGSETYALRAGDVIACTTGGPDKAHQILNDSDTETLRYLAISTQESPDLFEYPDSGKVGAAHYLGRDANGLPQALRLRNRTADNLDYWDGE